MAQKKKPAKKSARSVGSDSAKSASRDKAASDAKRGLFRDSAKNAGAFVSAIAKAFSVESIQEAVASGASIGGIVVKILADPVLGNLAGKDDGKFYAELKRIAERSLNQALELSEWQDDFADDLQRRIQRLPERLTALEGEAEPKFRHPLLFPPIHAVRTVVDEVLLSAEVQADRRRDFLRAFNLKCLDAFAADEWSEYFREYNARADRRNLDAYLANLRDAPNAPTAPDRPALRDVYVAERGYLLDHDEFGEFGTEGAKPIEDLPGFLDRYFADSKFGSQPHYRDEYEGEIKSHRMLVIAADYGAGKSTTTKLLAAEYAQRHLQTLDAPIPILLELKHLRESNPAHFLKEHYGVTLDSEETYLFLFDGLDESGSPTGDHFRGMLDRFKALLQDQYPNSSVVVTTRPVGGRNGELAGKVRSLCGRFVFLEGFAEEQAQHYLEQRKSCDAAVPRELTYETIASSLLSRPEDRSKPLFWDMALELFRRESLTVAGLAKRDAFSRTELYQYFLRELSVRARRGEPENKPDEARRRAIYRYMLRKLAVTRQYQEAYSPGKPGVSVEFFEKEVLTDEERKLYKEAQIDELLLISHFGRDGDHVEFLHASFREFLVAEALLETLLLGVRGRASREQLHVGFVSEACLEFYDELLRGWRAYLDAPEDEERRAKFRDFLFSIETSTDSTLERYVEDDATLNAGRSEEFHEKLFRQSVDWAADERVILGLKEFRAGGVAGEKQIVFDRALEENQTYCERWYALVAAQALRRGNDLLEVQAGSLLRAMTATQPFAPILRQKLWNLNLAAADLRGVRLPEARLDRVNLSDASLNNAVLEFACLHKADLSSANLHSAGLACVQLSQAKLREVNLQHAVLGHARLAGADIREGRLDAAKLNNSSFEHADLRGASLCEANLREADLEGADLRHTLIVSAHLQGANFSRAKLDYAQIDIRWKDDLAKQTDISKVRWINPDDDIRWKDDLARQTDISEVEWID